MKIGIALLTLTISCLAAHQPAIPPGSAIFVDSQNGFDKLLDAAFQSQHVPLRVVSSPDKADYTFDGAVMPVFDVVQTRSGRTVGDTSAEAVKLTSKSGEVIWRHAVSQRILKKGSQAVAEDCARHMKELVSKAARP